MQMMMQLSTAINLVGGATTSIFPRAEALLLSDNRYQEALKFVASKKDMDRYKSMMDFLFCELYTRWVYHCMRYYKGRGPLLRDQLKTKEILEYDRRLVIALEVARKLLDEDSCKSWTWYRFQAAQAA
ncbi:MAG: hypothetical protein MRY49_00670 [Candidatus Pacebacteria bacterium]|nr:hypothetical protein [Candidatus Paceibacterota bacterium]